MCPTRRVPVCSRALALAAFWPGVAERLLDEDLLLPASTHWWCGEDSVWQAQRARLSEFVVAATFPASATTQGFRAGRSPTDLDAARYAALSARVDGDAAAFTLQARRCCHRITPVWDRAGAVDLRAAVLRVFALA